MNMFNTSHFVRSNFTSAILLILSACSKDDERNPSNDENDGIQIRLSNSFENGLSDKDGKTRSFFRLNADGPSCT